MERKQYLCPLMTVYSIEPISMLASSQSLDVREEEADNSTVYAPKVHHKSLWDEWGEPGEQIIILLNPDRSHDWPGFNSISVKRIRLIPRIKMLQLVWAKQPDICVGTGFTAEEEYNSCFAFTNHPTSRSFWFRQCATQIKIGSSDISIDYHL